MKTRKTYFIVTALFAAYIIAVLCLTLLNLSDKTPELPKYFLGIPMDKFAHFLMFFAYPVTGWLLLTYNKQIHIEKHHYAILMATGLAFAVFTEIAQSQLTTYREGDPLDFVADAAGIVSATILIRIFRKPATRLCDSIQQYMHNRLYK